MYPSNSKPLTVAFLLGCIDLLNHFFDGCMFVAPPDDQKGNNF